MGGGVRDEGTGRGMAGGEGGEGGGAGARGDGVLKGSLLGLVSRKSGMFFSRSGDGRRGEIRG